MCQYYEQMNMQNGHYAIVVNQIPTNVQDDDEHHNVQNTQHNSPQNTTKQTKN